MPRPADFDVLVYARAPARLPDHPVTVGPPNGERARPYGSRWSAPLDERPNGHMAGDRFERPGPLSPWSRLRCLLSPDRCPSRTEHTDALVQRGRSWTAWLVPGDPHHRPGLDLQDEIRAPVPAAAAAWSSRHAGLGSGKSGASAGMGGRGLCHPQDGLLTLTGAAELQPGPGPCGQLRSRTADRMAVPVSPSIRARA